MYPRNAASPERIAIGPVIQISDGAVQTSGVAVKVIPFGSTEASGTGTVAYSADGVVLYTPVQGETNYTSFVLIASKSGCIPATQTIVTSIESTTGRVAANVTHFGGTAGTSSGGRPEVNMTQISGDAQAATQLALSAATIVSGTVDNTAFTPTTIEFEADDITEATAQHYNGRTVIFTSGVLLKQATSISNYSLQSGRGHFTVVALTEAPGNNDTFIIV